MNNTGISRQRIERMKIIETLDEAARAIPLEERPWAKEQKYQKELQERRAETEEILSAMLRSPRSKSSAYVNALEDLWSLVETDPHYQGDYSKELMIEALHFSIDVIHWVSNLTYHLNRLNTFHDRLRETAIDD